MSGILTIAATPIGNLDSVDGLFENAVLAADLILCEDTRVTGRLMNLKKLPQKKLISYREENEERVAGNIIAKLRDGANVLLLSDAGMPLVSDPGYRLAHLAVEEGIVINVVHGPTAFMEALLRSGMGTDRFCFLGFIPKKGKKKNEAVELMKNHDMSYIFYESPKRIRKVLAFIRERVPGIRYAICRELTKMHEEILRGDLDILDLDTVKEKGEFTVVVRRMR